MHRSRSFDFRSDRSVRYAACLVLACATILLLQAPGHAGTAADGVFGGIYTTLSGWVEGALGKIIATAMVLVGIGMGVARQSVMAFVVGIAGGLGLFSAPTVMAAIFTGTVDGVPPGPVTDLATAVQQIM